MRGTQELRLREQHIHSPISGSLLDIYLVGGMVGGVPHTIYTVCEV